MQCGGCGQENPERAKFCFECGTPLTAPAAPGSGESRRTVTVVFADMVGFTSLGESLDQESLRRVMDRFYAEMRGAIEAESGTLAKFIGDAVLAVWGTPEVREDDALRAVRAADAMRRALSGLNEDLQERWGVRVGMRTGVNTGEVVVDPTRPADLLVGDTLNVAARLEQAAADGEVLVGPDTFRLVRDEVVLEPVAPLALKGKARPMPAWRVVDARAGERRQEERLLAPLVGRDEELATLRTALDEVVGAGACRMTTVIGSPGLGKTRLVSEFVRAVGDEAVVLHGRCQATGEGITFQPVAEVLRGAAGIEDDETPEAARTKLGEMLPEDEPDRERIVERAASLLGLGRAASTEETFWAVRRILEALARDRPVVLVHDDIHWGQPTFLDLLEHFVEWIRDAPVFVLALARPELREVRPRLAEAGPLVHVIGLEPLDAEASRAMVSGLLGAADLPEGLARRVLETTEGNPLFLGEMLRMLADEGVLQRQGDTWVAGNLTDVTVPPTITALLAARIQRLEPDERSVVERAAVIGHAFYRGAVTDLAPAPVKPRVDGALETLGRKEMVRPEDEWWLDEQVFRFHHVLIRDAAYRSLLKEARAELHERFASWLEQKAGELAGEHEEVIAFHLEQAHAYRLELGPLDEPGRDLAARAGRRLHSAGRRALAREDLPAAANLLRRAMVPLDDDLRASAEVLVDLCEALLSAGDTGAAEPIVEELGLGAAELGDERLEARALVFALQLDNLTGAGHLREAADAAAEAAAVLGAAGDRAGEAKAHQVVAQAEALLGQVAAAEAALDRALVAARAADDRRRITAVLSGAPRAALWGPAPIVRASGRCLDVVRILRMTPGNRHVEAAALRSQAVLEAMRGRADAARGILGTCRVTLEELGLTLELRETAVHAGIVELLAGDAAAAEEHLRSAHDGFRALGIESGAAQAAALLGQALLEQGRDEEALEATRFAEQHGGEDLKTTAAWLGVRAEVLSRRGEHEEARALARRAAELTEPTDALADKADALMALAVVEAAAGDAAAARAAATGARELYGAKDHSVGVERAEAVAGHAEPGPAALPETPGVEVPPILTAFLDAIAARDWDGLRALHTPDYRFADSRSMGWEGGGIEEAIANNRSALEVVPQTVVTGEVLAAAPAAIAWISRWYDPVSEGELSIGRVVVLRDGLIARGEIFDADDRAGILARFADLTAGDREPAPLRLARAWQEVFNTRDWARARTLLEPDFATDDRRPLGIGFVEGHDQGVATIRRLVESAPEAQWVLTPLDVRESAGLFRCDMEGPLVDGGEFRIERLILIVAGPGGGMRRRIVFDLDQRAEADAEMAAIAGPSMSPLIRLTSDAWRAAFEAGDPERLARFYPPDVVLRDARPGIRNESVGREALVEMARSGREFNARVAEWRVVVETDSVVGFVHTLAGDTEPMGAWRLDHHQVIVADSRQRIAVLEIVEDEDAVRRRAAELAAAPFPPLAARAVDRLADILARRDWDALEACFAPDARLEDRRSGVVTLPEARITDVIGDIARSFAALGDDVSWVVEHIADAGELVCATRTTVGGTTPGGGAFEVAMYTVVECDEEGRQTRVASVDEQDEALALLDEWARGVAFAVAPWVDPGDETEQLRAWVEAFNRHDLEGMARYQSPDQQLIDHRPGIRNTVEGWDQARELWKWLFETVPDVRAEVLVLQSAPGVGHARMRYSSRLSDYEIATELVLQTAGGLGAATDIYELGDPAAAARYSELSAGGPAAARVVRRWQDAFNARDREAATAVLADGFVLDDRRPFGGGVVEGAEPALAHTWTITEVADDGWWEWSPLEASDHAGLFEAAFRGHSPEGGGFAMQTLHVVVLDGDRLARRIVFDLEQRTEAEAEYGAWDAHLRQARAQEELMNSGDFDRMRAEMFAPGYSHIDHRAAGSPVLDAEAMLTTLRNAFDMAPDGRFSTQILAVAGDARAQRITFSGHLQAGGGEAEVELWVHVRIDGMRNARAEVHPTREAAEAALHAAGAAEPPVVRYARAFEEAFNARDLDALDATAGENPIHVDHRPFGVGKQTGPTGEIATLLAVTPDAVWRGELVELARDDLALFHVRVTGTLQDGGSFEAEVYRLLWVDRQARLIRGDTFADEQLARDSLAAALDAPDESVAERDSPIARSLTSLERAFNDADWSALGALVVPDYRWADHRPGLRMETTSRDEFVALLRQARDGTDLHWCQTWFEERAGGRVGLAHVVQKGRYRDGPYEIAYLALTVVGEDGLGVLGEMYSEDDPAAWQRLDELARELTSGAPEVAATFVAARAAFNARDWDGFESCFAPEFVYSDHRTGLRETVGGRKAFIESMRGMAGRGDVRWLAESLEVRGSCELVRGTYAGTFRGGPFEVVTIDVHAVGADGRLVSADLWDEHGEAEARAAFAALAAGAGERPDAVVVTARAELSSDPPGEPTPVAEAYDALVAAFNARDWGRFSTFNHPGFVLHDHRPLLRGETLDHDGVAANFVATAGKGDLRWDVVRRVVSEGRAEITLSRWRGTTNGSPFEVEFLDLHGLAEDGRMAWSHTFSPEQEADARSMLSELAPAERSGSGKPPVLAYLRASEAAFNARDWEGLKALTAEAMVNVDHRPFGSGPQGPESGQLHALVEAIPDAVFRHDVIELLSPHRALLHLLVAGSGVDGGPVEIHLVRITDVDARGICVHNDVFEDEQTARAWLAAQ